MKFMDSLKSIPEKLASMSVKKFGLIAFLVSLLAALVIYGISAPCQDRNHRQPQCRTGLFLW